MLKKKKIITIHINKLPELSECGVCVCVVCVVCACVCVCVRRHPFPSARKSHPDGERDVGHSAVRFCYSVPLPLLDSMNIVVNMEPPCSPLL